MCTDQCVVLFLIVGYASTDFAYTLYSFIFWLTCFSANRTLEYNHNYFFWKPYSFPLLTGVNVSLTMVSNYFFSVFLVLLI